jgi:hypothetical protein
MPLHSLRKLKLFKVKVKVTLRLTISQSVSLGVEPDIFSSFRWTPSLTRGQFCLLYLPLAFASAVFLGRSP